MVKHGIPWLLGSVLACAVATAQSVVTSPPGEAVERQMPDDLPHRTWSRDPERVETEDGDRMERREVEGEALETIKLTKVVPPIRFDSGAARIPDATVERIRKALDAVRDRRNVRLHLVGHADDQRLSEDLVRTYGDNAGLSRERAAEVAEFLQQALALAPESVSYEWAGDTRPIASNATAEGRAANRRVEVEVWYDEPRARVMEEESLYKPDIRQIKVCRVDTLCRMRFREGQARRARVKNLVPALHYTDEGATVTPEFVEHIRKAFGNLGDKQNVQVKFIGYTDDAPLSGRNARIYGDALALSKARAQRVALAVQEALKLPSAAIAIDGRGASTPVAANDTAQGRAQNRRIEVQFWHDDPLQELPEEPQLCPGDDTEVVTRVYDPPWGSIPRLELQNGRAIIPASFTATLRRAMTDIAGRDHVRLRFIGYTANERLDRRTAAVYGDHIGLSAARARRAMETIREEMQLAPTQVEHEGRGYLQSPDVVNLGFTQGDTSYVDVQVVYDEAAVRDDYEGVEITRLTRELTPKSPFALNGMHITVDGKPIDDPSRSSADVQRCTDVALDQADIRFQFDNLKLKRRLAVTATQDPDSPGSRMVHFRMYSNYASFIDTAEVRIFPAGQSTRAVPVAVVPLDADGYGEWLPRLRDLPQREREFSYVLRAYDANGKFDDTAPRTLRVTRGEPGTDEPQDDADAAAETTETAAAEDAPVDASTPEPGDGSAADDPQAVDNVIADVLEEAEAALQAAAESATEIRRPEPALLAAYGENEVELQNIRLDGGTVTVRGSGIPAGHTVWVAGYEVPVDAQGNFIAEEILPGDTHTVEVAVLDAEGRGSLYLRDLEFRRRDRFFVGMADVTVSSNHTSGAADLLQGGNRPFEQSNFDGRLAFYGTEKLNEEWRLTASADTREGPIKDLFSNFLSKSPDALFRRIDPDNHYPTFGDDGVVEEMAPTLGKFYVRVDKGESRALWGNFRTSYVDNELAQVDRGLYGASGHWQSDAKTGFGEQRAAVDAFAAEPGTIAGRDEFRGTGGSLYYLRNQDILTGSERVRIEMRDKDSGLVTGTVNLRPALDYDIDYLQGRVLLAEPLSSTGADKLLVRTGALGGEEAYLVVRYEYSPGFDRIDTLATGGQAHVWLNDAIRVGLTGSRGEEGASDSSLRGADITLRRSADSWFKFQGAQSEGLVSSSLVSNDGGFGFSAQDPLAFDGASADGYRADLAIGLGDFIRGGRGRVALYTQNLGAGYSAPGQASSTDRQQFGGVLSLPVGEKLNLRAKGDRKDQDLGLQKTAVELNASYQMNERWSVGTGVRRDERRDGAAIVPLTQEQGERTDALVQVAYDPRSNWRAYGFAQQTVSSTETREDNGRFGVGGSYRPGKRLRFDAEASAGDLGPGGKLGTNYLMGEGTNLYLNYLLENERADSGLQGRRDSLISGMKRRLTDSSSVFVEERYQDTDLMSGLTHATGVTLTARNRWNLGANLEYGTLEDSQTGAETDRRAAGVRVGYAFESVQLSSGVEYRDDDAQQLDMTHIQRRTWLFRNNLRYQLTPDWRLVGKLNYSTSDSSQGQFYDGGYTEAVIGYGFRPVQSDRLDALAKYTYFYNMPTTGQRTLQGTAAQYVQKSHIGSLDATYRLTDQWSLGGKYAYRLGEVALDRRDPQFFDNRAQLVILRVDWRFRERWESMIEGRVLDMPDLDERRAGTLVAVYRYVGAHVKAGAGYNFTDFSDDLTDLSFRSRGVFVNVIGTL